jgi:glycosyltransferase involved in cell wall biosynthesis
VIHVCIPAHNEDRTIGVLLWKIRNVMAEFGRDYEVVALDDGSTDRTPEVLLRYRRFLPLRVIRAEERRGYGPALERILRDVVERSTYPKRDVVVTIQGDFTENPEDLVAMVKTIEGGADLVAGALAEAASLPGRMRMARGIARLLLGGVARGAPVSDLLSGFRAYRLIVVKKALRDLEDGRPLLVCDGWGANLELLARTAPHARRIEEARYRLRSEHRSRESRFRPIPSLRMLLSLRGTSWPSAAPS